MTKGRRDTKLTPKYASLFNSFSSLRTIFLFMLFFDSIQCVSPSNTELFALMYCVVDTVFLLMILGNACDHC